jgi:hypothetical protein
MSNQPFGDAPPVVANNPFADQAANPYAAPTHSYEVLNPAHTVGVFRMSDNRLVVHKAAALPAVCIKTGLAAETSVRRTLYWHHPLLILLVVFPGILIYAIVALIVRKSATLQFPITYRARNKLRWRLAVGFISLLGAPICLFIGVSLAHNQSEVFGWIGAFLFLALFINAIVFLLLGRLVTPTKITDQFCVVKGVSPQYLAILPQWPYGADVP